MTGRDPYCVFHGLRDDYVPVEGGVPMPPPYPARVQNVVYAFGIYSQQRKEQLAGVKKRPERRRKKEV